MGSRPIHEEASSSSPPNSPSTHHRQSNRKTHKPASVAALRSRFENLVRRRSNAPSTAAADGVTRVAISRDGSGGESVFGSSESAAAVVDGRKVRQRSVSAHPAVVGRRSLGAAGSTQAPPVNRGRPVIAACMRSQEPQLITAHRSDQGKTRFHCWR